MLKLTNSMDYGHQWIYEFSTAAGDADVHLHLQGQCDAC